MKVLQALIFLVSCAILTSCNSGKINDPEIKETDKEPETVLSMQLRSPLPGDSKNEKKPEIALPETKNLNSGFSSIANNPDSLLVFREMSKNQFKKGTVEPEDFFAGPLYTEDNPFATLLQKEIHPVLSKFIEGLSNKKLDKSILGSQARVILNAHLTDILSKIDAFSTPRYLAKSQVGENEALIAVTWWSPERELALQVYMEKIDKVWKINDIIIDNAGRNVQSSLNYSDYSPKEIERTLKKEGIIR